MSTRLLVTQVAVLQALFWAVMLICRMEKEEEVCQLEAGGRSLPHGTFVKEIVAL